MPTSDVSPEPLWRLAHAGDHPALGQLPERYRNDLRLLARTLVKGVFRARLDPSGRDKAAGSLS